jgi:hypothetical protein
MMSKITVCFLRSLALGGLLAVTGCGRISNALAQRAQREIDSKLLHLNNSCYGYQISSDGSPGELLEMKSPSVELEPSQLDAGDKANGIEWRGKVHIVCKVYRTAGVVTDNKTKEVISVGKWSDWKDGSLKDTSGNMYAQMSNTKVESVPLFDYYHGGVFQTNGIELTIRNGKWLWSVNNAPIPTHDIVQKATQ